MNSKLVNGIVGAEILGCLTLAAVCYAKAEYYRGRITMRNEIENARQEMIKEFIQKVNDSEEEA